MFFLILKQAKEFPLNFTLFFRLGLFVSGVFCSGFLNLMI